MARQIYIVSAHIVDANGAFHMLDGYPRTFDSNSYSDRENPTETARRRAESDFSECWAAMCKRDDRMIQTVTLGQADGYQIDRKTYGDFPGEPVAE